MGKIIGNTKNHPSKKDERLGEKRINKQGFEMEIVEYENSNHIIIQFNDLLKTRVSSTYTNFQRENIMNPNYRVGLTNWNKQGCLMTIVEYNGTRDLWVEFQDKYKYRTHCTWKAFLQGTPVNPNIPTVYGVGVVGSKYKIMKDGKQIREYKIWNSILQRCFNKKKKEEMKCYQEATCCEEWLYFPNFYEWLHSQENFDKWVDGKFHIDKDIIIKGNKIYSPKTCCLVPQNVNALFTKTNAKRGDTPIGVSYHNRDNIYEVQCCNPYFSGDIKVAYLGRFRNENDAFLAYKKYKEDLIKRIAQDEYEKGNIIKQCYEAMMNYQVEITD